MANIEMQWTVTQEISIRDYAARAGFNLHAIDLARLNDDKRKWITDKITKMILGMVEEAWEGDGWQTPFADLEKAVYVITMADNIAIKYNTGTSQVLYIGRGQVKKRLKSHLVNWVSHLSESLQDIKFKFWLSEIKKQGSPTAYKDVESDLICQFKHKFGEFPLLNKKNGDSCSVNHTYDKSFAQPFRPDSKVKKGWCIRPMHENEWFREIEDEDD